MVYNTEPDHQKPAPQEEKSSSQDWTKDKSSDNGTYTLTVTDAYGSLNFATQVASAGISSNPSQKALTQVVSSSAARANRLDSTHRFIRTAEIRFRALNVPRATYSIEKITGHFGGYVADTKLRSEMLSMNLVHVSTDSSLETMRFMVTNTLTLRVPSEKLDTFLTSLVPLIDYLDHRNINTQDITLEVVSNQLAQNRLAKFNVRMAANIDNKGKKLPDIGEAEESMLRKQEQSDNSLIENLRFDDQVRYSTINMQIYQRENIRQELILRERSVSAYQPGLGSRLGESFLKGWNGFRTFLSVLVLLWPIWVIVAISWFTIRWFVRRNAGVLAKAPTVPPKN